MVEVEVIRERLAKLREYTDDLRERQDIHFAEYEGDKVVRRYIEHTLQIAVEVCLDIGHHLIAEKHLPLPKEHRDIFTTLGEHGIVPQTIVPTLRKMVGFRNRIVHEYEKVDNALVFGILKKNLGDFDEFRDAIYKFLDREAQAAAEKAQSAQPVQSETDLEAAAEKGRAIRERKAKYIVRRKRKPRSR